MLGSSCPDVTCKKVAVKNFAKFTGKHLCWSLPSDKVAGRLQIFWNFQRQIFSKTSAIDHLWTFSTSWLLRKENIILKATTTVNQRKHVDILILKFYLKSRSTTYFIKIILKQSFINFHFHSFPCWFFTLVKNRFHYV